MVKEMWKLSRFEELNGLSKVYGAVLLIVHIQICSDQW